MPGYILHLACAGDTLRTSPLAVKGLIAPDVWKKAPPTEEEYCAFFRDCPRPPSYEEVKLLCSEGHGGTHFGEKAGVTNHANLALFAALLHSGHVDAANPFYLGYLHHLKTDLLFYADTTLCDGEAYARDCERNRDEALEELHRDWDRSNPLICERYPEVAALIPALPDAARGVIRFTNAPLRYVLPDRLFAFVEHMRRLDDMEALLS